ncbi:MAG: S-layer homology domain-containing protein, partial [Anaerolineales bacterium]
SVYSYSPWFADSHFINTTGSTNLDINDGGMANGEGYSTRHSGKNHFELRFPLCSSDIYHDFCLYAGDTVGFRLEYIDAFMNPTFDFVPMFYPGAENYDPLALIEIGNGVPTPTFQDVPLSHWAHAWIERLYNAGITTGCSQNPLMYCPESPVSRAQMAIFLERGMKYPNQAYTPPPATGSIFGDVPAQAFASDWIEQLFADGITSGCGSGNYCPSNPVTRAQMAIFLLRAEHGAQYIPPDVGQSTGFNDVGPSDFAAAWIKQLALEGITTGCGGGNYCPNASVTRSQMAVFLVRTFDLP